MTKEALSKHFEYKLIHTYTNLTVIRAHPKNDSLSSRRSPTKSYLAFQQNLTMLLNKFPLSAFLQQSPFLAFQQNLTTLFNKFLLSSFEQIPFICFSRYLHVGYYFSNKFQQNLTTLLNKFPLTCFSRWLPFFKQNLTTLKKFPLTCFSRYFQVGYHFSKEKTISNLNLRWC